MSIWLDYLGRFKIMPDNLNLNVSSVHPIKGLFQKVLLFLETNTFLDHFYFFYSTIKTFIYKFLGVYSRCWLFKISYTLAFPTLLLFPDFCFSCLFKIFLQWSPFCGFKPRGTQLSHSVPDSLKLWSLLLLSFLKSMSIVQQPLWFISCT